MLHKFALQVMLIRVIEIRRMKWGEVRNVYTTCIGKHEEKTTVWMWEANIKIAP